MSKKLVFMICFGLFFKLMQAQESQITGQVTDANGEPLELVTVTVVETNLSAKTDQNGTFHIGASVGQTLRFSLVGAEPKTHKITDIAPIQIQLDINLALEEVVITGYQVQRKADLTGSVAVVDMKDSKDIPSGSVLQNIQGKVPGLYIQSDGSSSGRARTVSIRGQNTLGNTSPLYIIDGIPTTDPNILQFMDPNTIESMQVLKDASAASIYGSRASNGVIVVTTKQGKDRVSVSVNSSITAASIARRIDMLDTETYGRALWRASVNDGTPTSAHSALYSFEETGEGSAKTLQRVIPVQYINGDTNIPSANTDWQDEVFKTGIVSNTNVTFSAGNDKSATLFSFGYFSNSGTVINNAYDRFSGRANNSVNLFNGKLKIGENFQIIKAKENPMGGDQYGQAGWDATGKSRLVPVGSNPIQLATTILPILPVRKLDGSFAGPIGSGFSDRMNPVFLADLDKDDTNSDLQTFGNAYLDFKPIENLTFRSNFGIDYTYNNDRNIERTYSHGFINRTVNNLSIAQRNVFNWTWSNTINYLYIQNKSRLNVMGGMEAIKNSIKYYQSLKQGFAVQSDEYFQLGAGTGIASNDGFSLGNQLVSYFGKADYSFDERYLLSATVRYDGSSRFGENNKFGMFPAVSVGWVISNEGFIKNQLDWVSNLKLRAGMGKTGNQEIGDYSRFQTFVTNYGTVESTIRATGTAYDINGDNTGNLHSGYVAKQSANPNLRWETTNELNVGLDFGFLANRLTGSFDYFNRETSDILVTPPTPGVLGEGAAKTVNGATMLNKGFEVSLGYQDQQGDLFYSITGNVSHFHDEITYLPSSVVRSFPGNVEKDILGRSRSSLFGYVTDGLFQSQEEVDAHATQPGKGIGRIRYRDLNSDGTINALDQDWLGTELPGFIYGVNVQVGYKNFSLAVFMRGVGHVTVNDGSKNYTDFLGTASGVNKGSRLLDAWTPENRGSNIPALSLVNANNELRASDYFLVSGDYFKIQQIQLGYTLPERLAKAAKLGSVRIYGVADNALLFFNKSKDKIFTGPDPETPGAIYPRPIRYTVGLDIQF
ncbi:TonB-dependent receptor [Parapedobacter defluvii]|uniref:SusC/RagA family TonB-linked outer membrane protein n=1 Tax=Parapedobacter defluvii TaxID=2045106 RepID=UPI003341DE31